MEVGWDGDIRVCGVGLGGGFSCCEDDEVDIVALSCNSCLIDIMLVYLVRLILL